MPSAPGDTIAEQSKLGLPWLLSANFEVAKSGNDTAGLDLEVVNLGLVRIVQDRIFWQHAAQMIHLAPASTIVSC